MKIYLASGNAHKLGEIRDMVLRSGLAMEIDSARAVGGMPEVDENAGTFEGNARLKADALCPLIPPDSWALADDSGLEVDALGGAPGVYSSRFAGVDASDGDNLNKLLVDLAGVPASKRTARFRCVLVMKNRDGNERVFNGTCEGSIATAATGGAGFGYDPVFVPIGHAVSFGELGDAAKSRLSHRGMAIDQLLEWAVAEQC